MRCLVVSAIVALGFVAGGCDDSGSTSTDATRVVIPCHPVSSTTDLPPAPPGTSPPDCSAKSREGQLIQSALQQFFTAAKDRDAETACGLVTKQPVPPSKCQKVFGQPQPDASNAVDVSDIQVDGRRATALVAGDRIGLRKIGGQWLISDFFARQPWRPPALTARGNDQPSDQTSTAATIEAAIKEQPTAGACALTPRSQAVGVIRLNPDTPEPRCLEIRPDQRLRLINTSDAFGQKGEVTSVAIAAYRAKLAPGRHLSHRPVGRFLAPGDHLVGISLYAGGGAEVLVRAG
jgi:hypothetical protein